QIIKLVFTLLLLMLAVPSHCAIYSEINKAEKTSDLIKYWYTISEWDYEDSTPNPCYGLTSCYVAISHRHNTAGGPGNTVTSWSANGVKCISSSKNIGELGVCLKDSPSNIKGTNYPWAIGIHLTIPFSGDTVHGGAIVYPECVGMFWSTTPIKMDSPGSLLPGSVCGLAPAPTGNCGMPDSIMLDHGSVPNNSIDGSKAVQQITIDCNNPLSGRLFLQGLTKGKLPVGGGIYSTISLNNLILNESGVKIPLVGGANPLLITSTLSTSGQISGGEHVGHGVLILTLD
ncbi:hypothetical protein, partial [Serratia marcescens]|uniref:MrpH family fimbial adhesin n=1 Tax=Serratia marcescens TaxID=615 RepID=UPI0013D9B501